MKWLIRLFKYAIGIGILFGAAGVIAVLSFYYHLEPELPAVEQLRDVQLQVPLRVYSRDQRLIAEFGEQRRIPLIYNEIPDQMILAFLAAEDDRFFKHPGVDYQGILRAAAQLVMTGERRQGGSTITMQVARNFFLTPEKTFIRKLKEVFLALRIEQELSKEEIFALYLNKIYFGNRAYGVGAAAEVYYGKAARELNLAQAAMIAGLPKAPSRFNPLADPERALIRRNYVLGRMEKLGFISEQEYQTATNTPVSASLHIAKPEAEAPYLAEMVRADMVERFGEDAYTAGYRVYTTLDSRLQETANRAVRENLHAYDQRHGFRGAEQHLELTATSSKQDWDTFLANYSTIGDLVPALVIEVEDQSVKAYTREGQTLEIGWEGLKWARPHINENRLGPAPKSAGDILKAGDLIRILSQSSDQSEAPWRLAQIPTVEGALVSLDPNSGAIVALVGGYDFYHSKFNRITQAKRQPGSGFKAFIYSAALDAGYTPASLINDAPVVFDDPSLEGAWRPENYSGRFFGPTRLREALTHSRNLVSIRLLRAIGVDKALSQIERFGFDTTELPRNLSLALGSGAVTPLQMAKGYAVLANGGYRIEPYYIERIEQDHHEPLFQATPLRVCHDCEQTPAPPNSNQAAEGDTLQQNGIAPRVISRENHYLMNSMMQDVIKRGTGRRAMELGRNDLAGKTGTTNDQRDAWFNGFHPSLVAITWTGFDSSQPLGKGEVGGRAALPAWIAFMRVALEGIPEHPLEMPPGMIMVRIDPQTGMRASAGQRDAIFEVFRAADAPPESPGTSGSGSTPAQDTTQLF